MCSIPDVAAPLYNSDEYFHNDCRIWCNYQYTLVQTECTVLLSDINISFRNTRYAYKADANSFQHSLFMCFISTGSWVIVRHLDCSLLFFLDACIHCIQVYSIYMVQVVCKSHFAHHCMFCLVFRLICRLCMCKVLVPSTRSYACCQVYLLGTSPDSILLYFCPTGPPVVQPPLIQKTPVHALPSFSPMVTIQFLMLSFSYAPVMWNQTLVPLTQLQMNLIVYREVKYYDSAWDIGWFLQDSLKMH